MLKPIVPAAEPGRPPPASVNTGAPVRPTNASDHGFGWITARKAPASTVILPAAAVVPGSAQAAVAIAQAAPSDANRRLRFVSASPHTASSLAHHSTRRRRNSTAASAIEPAAMPRLHAIADHAGAPPAPPVSSARIESATCDTG